MSEQINAASLCLIGQESVADFLVRANNGVFVPLKNLQCLNGFGLAEIRTKNEILGQLQKLSLLMERIRLIYEKCSDLTKDLDTHGLIPLEDDWYAKVDELKQNERYKELVAEREALRQELTHVNAFLKESINIHRSVIFQ